MVERAPQAAVSDRRRYDGELGRASYYLLRPDGYVALGAGAHAAAARLAAGRQRWFPATERAIAS